MSNISNRDKWSFDKDFLDVLDFRDKEKCVSYYVRYMLDRSQKMFNYSGLPDTLPHREIELIFQTKGYIVIPIPNKSDYPIQELYAFGEGAYLGGERNVYYMPTICNISSPALNWSGSLEIGTQCVVIPNDSMYMGMLPMYKRYATMLVENDITISLAQINTRILNIISAMNDRGFDSAKKFIDDIKRGELGIIADNAFTESIKVHNASTNYHNITQLIELEQYIKASWFNEIGLNANYNMKREAINSNESQLNYDCLIPLPLDMLECRKKGFDIVNKICGTNIQVELNSIWKEQESRGVTNETN